MNRLWLALVWSGCGGTVAVEGRVVDGLTGGPMAGPFQVNAKAASADAAISCQIVSAEVDAEGHFSLPNLCVSTAYALATDQGDLWLTDGMDVPAGGWPQAQDVIAFRVPKDAGIHRLSAGELSLVKSNADVVAHQVWKSQNTVRAPDAVPNEVVNVGPEDHLVLLGASATNELKFFPLVPYTGKRFFGEGERSYSVPDWYIVGAKAVDDTTYEPVAAVFDATKVVDKTRGSDQVRYISGAALPAGRYAVLRDEDRRMTLIDFGS